MTTDVTKRYFGTGAKDQSKLLVSNPWTGTQDYYAKANSAQRKAATATSIEAQLAYDQLNYEHDLNQQDLASDRAYNEWYYNTYESPQAMMNQYQDAGLNPYSVLSGNNVTGSSNSGASSSTPSAADSSAPDLAGASNQAESNRLLGLSTMLSGINSIIDTQVKFQQMKQMSAQTEAQNIANQQALGMNPLLLQNMGLTNNTLSAQLSLSKQAYEQNEKRFPSELGISQQSYENLKQQYDLSHEELLQIRKTYPEMYNLLVKQVEGEGYKNEGQRLANSYQREANPMLLFNLQGGNNSDPVAAAVYRYMNQTGNKSYKPFNKNLHKFMDTYIENILSQPTVSNYDTYTDIRYKPFKLFGK